MIWGIFYRISFCLLLFSELHALKIHVFSVHNGKGLETSRNILMSALDALGHETIAKDLYEHCDGDFADINIFFEIINEDWLSQAPLNWFIPNPECYLQELSVLDSIDLILCRTHEVERIFQALNKRTYYLGFTSRDCRIPRIKKDWKSCLHLAGSSVFKGTEAIKQAWRSQPNMPRLSIVAHYDISPFKQQNIAWITSKMPLASVRELQNRSGIHLCLSETEGFGHYLMEAMSTGAVVITTDAPPMNEFIQDKRCLVPYRESTPFQLSTRYFADPGELTQKIRELTHQELNTIGDQNRRVYLQKTEEFYENLQKIFELDKPLVGSKAHLPLLMTDIDSPAGSRSDESRSLE